MFTSRLNLGEVWPKVKLEVAGAVPPHLVSLGGVDVHE
jgi:hypothetical protein